MPGFEKEFEKFLEVQKRGARGQRLEMLNRDLTGTKKMLEAAVWPVFGSFEGMVLEHEMASQSGVRIYGDVFVPQVNSILEAEGYAVHAENITRDRFSFEKMRIRTIMMYGYKFIPFSWDELDKKAESCRRAVYELLGHVSSQTLGADQELTVHEREVVRHALRLNRSFRLGDVCRWLLMTPKPCRVVVRKMMDKKLIKPIGSGQRRYHEYILDERAGRMV